MKIGFASEPLLLFTESFFVSNRNYRRRRRAGNLPLSAHRAERVLVGCRRSGRRLPRGPVGSGTIDLTTTFALNPMSRTIILAQRPDSPL